MGTNDHDHRAGSSLYRHATTQFHRYCTAKSVNFGKRTIAIFFVLQLLVLYLWLEPKYRQVDMLIYKEGDAPTRVHDVPGIIDVSKFGMQHLCEVNGLEVRKGPKPRVFDMFTFRAELDMLELRLNELSPVVDTFILVEAVLTLSGKPKPLIYDEYKNDRRFLPFKDRIVHVIVDSDEAGVTYTDMHDRLAWQRSHLVEGLDRAGAGPDDFVIYSDVDEVPSSEHVKLLKDCTGYGFPVTFQTPVYLYDFGCKEEDQSWKRIKMAKRKQIKAECGWNIAPSAVCPHDLRDDQNIRLGLTQNFPPPLTLRDAGWHMSFFSEIDDMVLKLKSYSHPERNTKQNRDKDYLKCMVHRCMHVNRYDKGERLDDPLRDIQKIRVPNYVRERVELDDPAWLRFFPAEANMDQPDGVWC